MVKARDEGGVMGDFGAWRLVPHQVAYAVDNPRFWALDAAMRSAEMVAPVLWACCDAASTHGPLAWSGGKAEETFGYIDAVKSRARRGATDAVEDIRAARDREPRTLTRYRTDWVYEWEEH